MWIKHVGKYPHKLNGFGFGKCWVFVVDKFLSITVLILTDINKSFIDFTVQASCGDYRIKTLKCNAFLPASIQLKRYWKKRYLILTLCLPFPSCEFPWYLFCKSINHMKAYELGFQKITISFMSVISFQRKWNRYTL